MDRKFSSILDELTVAPIRDRDVFIEQRGEQVVASFINLIKLINESYAHDVSLDLNKRLINAIRTGDVDKFKRGIKGLGKSGRES